MVRDDAGRWGALLLKIAGDGAGRYKVTNLTRADERTLQPRTSEPQRRHHHRLAAPVKAAADLLGPPPDSADGKLLWEAATIAVDAYRSRWGITDPTTALGPAKDLPAEQAADRTAVVDRLKTVLTRLRELSAPEHSPTGPMTSCERQTGAYHDLRV